MAILTKEQKEHYLKHHAAICPFCGSNDISGGSMEVEATEAWQNITCCDCHETWRDVYKLSFVETEDELMSK